MKRTRLVTKFFILSLSVVFCFFNNIVFASEFGVNNIENYKTGEFIDENSVKAEFFVFVNKPDTIDDITYPYYKIKIGAKFFIGENEIKYFKETPELRSSESTAILNSEFYKPFKYIFKALRDKKFLELAPSIDKTTATIKSLKLYDFKKSVSLNEGTDIHYISDDAETKYGVKFLKNGNNLEFSLVNCNDKNLGITWKYDLTSAKKDLNKENLITYKTIVKENKKYVLELLCNNFVLAGYEDCYVACPYCGTVIRSYK